MILSGTDLVALACIAGSATVGGAATVAAMRADGPGQMACATVSARGSHRMVVVKEGRAATVILSPDVHVDAPGCQPAMGQEIEVRLESAQLQKEIQLRLQSELRRVQMELQGRQTELEARQQELQAGKQELQARQQELQARQQELQARQQALRKR